MTTKDDALCCTQCKERWSGCACEGGPYVSVEGAARLRTAVAALESAFKHIVYGEASDD